MWKDLKKQGVKYILTIPPHYYSGDAKNDVFIIKMFIKRKKYMICMSTPKLMHFMM